MGREVAQIQMILIKVSALWSKSATTMGQDAQKHSHVSTETVCDPQDGMSLLSSTHFPEDGTNTHTHTHTHTHTNTQY